MTTKQTVRLIIDCQPPIPTDGEFGLQDKQQTLIDAAPLPDGSLRFECTLDATTDTPPNWTGRFAHGAPTDRFLYLSLRRGGEWLRRIKIPLKSVTAEQIASGRALHAVVNGRAAATVQVDWMLV